MDPIDKIQLDDITFDDVISGDGVDVVETPEIDPIETDEPEADPVIGEVEIPEEEAPEDSPEEEEEPEETPEETDEDDVGLSVVNEVLEKLGYEGGEYDDTPEGLANMTSDIASQMADDRIDKVLEEFPLVKKHLDYVLSGGESQNFMEAYDPNLDYSKLTIAEDDHMSQKAILGDYLELKGHDKDFINEMLEDFEDTGKLHAKSEAARNALAKHQDQTRIQMAETQRQETERANQQLEEFWGNVADTISDSDQFAGISVPEREKEAFFQYLSTPVNRNGHTQRDVDHSEAELEKKLAIDYLMYKGFDLSGLIQSKAKTQNATTLRNRISSNEAQAKNTRRSNRKSKNVDFDNLDLSI